MAYIPLEDRLQLRVNTGTAADPIFRTRSWNNVKPGVSDAVLYDFAAALRSLTAENVEQLYRIRIGTLEED